MKEWFAGLAERERVVLVGGSIAGIVLLVLFLVLGLYANVSEARQNVEEKRELAAWMDSAVLRVREASTKPGTNRCRSRAGQSLAVIIDTTVRDAKLTQFQKEARPAGGPDRVSVRFESVPFDNLVRWVGTMGSTYCLTIETASVDRGKTPGTSDVRVILERPAQ